MSDSKSWRSGTTSQAMAGVGRAGFIRDPSGLLMSIIRTLASSSDDERQKEHEKERLEEAFAENDAQLDELVAQNYEEVAVSIKQFGKIGDRIADSCIKIKKVRENLQQCKSLLYCRQDELRKLWIEGVEHKKVLFLLDQIERVKEAPQKIEEYMNGKYYLHATELLLQTLKALEKELVKVEALHDIRNELIGKKMVMHERFISELHHQIYISSTVARSKKQPSARVKLSIEKPSQKTIDDDEKKIGKFDAKVLELEDLEVDPDDNSMKLMTVLVESLHRLKRIPDAVEAIKTRMERYINDIVTHTTIEVTDMAFESDNKSSENNPNRLLQLLNSLFEKFHGVASAHMHVLSALKSIELTLSLDVPLYDIEEVWAQIQSVIQSLLNDYLDADNVVASSQQMAALGFADSGSLSSYFSRKKAARPRAAKLFRFDGSSHAISMNNYLREQRAQRRILSIDSTTSPLLDHALSTQKVCKPNPRNITIIFGPLKNFIKEIETSLNYTGNKKCALNDFITDYVQDVFIRQIQYELKKDFDAAMKVTDPLKVLADANVQKSLGNYRSLLQSTVVADQCMWFLYDLTCSLDSYHDHFLTMACSLLQEYKEMSTQSYRGVVQPNSEDQRVLSASWVRDGDVNDLLLKMDSWKAANGNVLPKGTNVDDAYMQEATFFVEKINGEPINKNMLVDDATDLKALASLHESLEWMTARLQSFVTSINKYASQDILQMLENLAKDYRRMSEICFVCIHIEVRINCFYHLLPMLRNSSYDIRGIESMEHDQSITDLMKDINAAEENLNSSLPREKYRYVFEGLGSLISAILINGAKYIRRISSSGIKKMCRNVFTIQQLLTNVTSSRESNLDTARQYYEMLYLMPDDLQAQVVEQGVRYIEEDYVEALNLLHRSKPGSGDDNQQRARVQRLRAIVREQTYKKEHAEKMQKLKQNT